MKYAVIAGALLLGACFYAPSSAATDPTQAAIQAMYDNACTQIKTGDVDKTFAFLAPDYVGTQPSGEKIDRARAISSLKTNLAAIAIVSCSAKIDSVAKAGDRYNVTVEQSLDATLNQNSAPLHIASTTQASWKLTNGQWQELASTLLENTVTMNGNVVQHLGGPASPAAAPSSKPRHL